MTLPRAIHPSSARRPLAMAAALALVLGSLSPAFGLTLEYALDRAPELVKCDRLAYAGDSAGAQTCFQALIGANEDLRIKADAAR